MNIKINSHSSIQIDDNVYFDPFNIEENMPKAKIIFITHSHYDHFSSEDILKIADNNTTFVATSDCTEAESLPHKEIFYVKPNQTFEVCDIKVETLPAYNINKKFHPKENLWVAYKITLNKKTYLVCGDSDATEELLSAKTDVLFIPIGGTYTMTAKEAASATNKIKPELVIPTHYNAIVGSKADEKEFVSALLPEINCKILIK